MSLIHFIIGGLKIATILTPIFAIIALFWYWEEFKGEDL